MFFILHQDYVTKMENKKRNHYRGSLSILLFGLVVILSIVTFIVLSEDETKLEISPYPNGKNFAFTITDDPDYNKLDAIRPLYDFLNSLDMKTTVAVWVEDPVRTTGIPDVLKIYDPGDSCEKKEYCQYIQYLQDKGFEIALHTVSGGNDFRERTIEGYEKFKSLFGKYPKINIMHSNNLENIYWGKKVVNNRALNKIIGLLSEKSNLPYSGEIPESDYFWGDILKANTKYVRLWGTTDINTLKFNPSMPYHDPKKPFVNYWFSFSDGYNVDIFNKLISEQNVKKLKKERGTSIVYTHFSSKFTRKRNDGIYYLDEVFKDRIEKLAGDKQGWFVPASEILDRLLLMKNVNVFSVDNGITIVNSNSEKVDGITLISKDQSTLYDSNGKTFLQNREGEIILDEIKANSSLTLFKRKNQEFTKNEVTTVWEELNMIIKRSIILLKHRVLR